LKKPVVVLLLVSGAVASACARKGRDVVEPGATADVTRSAGEWLRMEPVRLLREYIRIDTRQETGEQEGAEFLKNLFDCAGIDS
jgi:hypothetical protein